MIASDYRFPLYDEILYGSMTPFSPTNSFESFLLNDTPRVNMQAVPDNGIFTLFYPKPPNLKCSFYYFRLIYETRTYCNDLLDEFQSVSDPDIRAYWRTTLLDRHLKTALIKTGEILREHKLTMADFTAPTPDTPVEKLSDSYIFHLLKVCLAKAYLEFQQYLEPSAARQLNETYLYSGFAGETPPVKSCLTKKTTDRTDNPRPTINPQEKKPETKAEKISPALNEKTYTLTDLTSMKLGSARTLRRKLVKGELKGYKNGKTWLIEESELKRYVAELKTKTNNKK